MSGSPSDGERRKALASVYALVVVDLIGFGIVLPILPFYAESYGAGAVELGALVTSYAAMQMIFAPLWGRLSDRVGRRPVLLLTIAGTAVSLALLAMADSLLWIFAARIAAGAFAANVSVAAATITDLVPTEERARYLGLLGACFAVGFTLGPAIGAALVGFGESAPIFAAAALAALNWLAALRYLKEPTTSRATQRESRSWWPKESRLQRMVVSSFFFAVAITQLETLFPFFMLDVYGWDARQVAIVLVGMAVLTGAVQGGAVRPLVQRLGERRLWLLGTVLLIPSLALVPVAPSVALLALPLAVASVGRGIAQPAMMALTTRAADDAAQGAALGAYQSAASAARVIGPITAGLLYAIDPLWPFLLASAAMSVVAALAVGHPPNEVGEPADRLPLDVQGGP
ncbi:MAG: MFS transporter [Acidobacteriota bacterium]